MSNSKTNHLTDWKSFFLQPSNSTHRQYEALRAFFVEGLASAEVASRFGYTPGSFRVLCHEFRQQPQRAFFLPPGNSTPPTPKRDRRREQIITLRKQNLSIYDIAKVLTREGQALSPAMVAIILKEEGFAKLPRRHEDERPDSVRAEPAAVADVRQLDLTPRSVRTQFGGLFLFLPWLSALPFDALLKQAGLPGSRQIPAGTAMRSLLALKLFGNARHSHIMSHVFDEGLGLFAGLNVIPKRAFLSEYSSRIHPESYPKLMRGWFDAVAELGLSHGVSFDLDFHTIPFHGEAPQMEKHYVSKRSRRQKGVLAFLAQDADQRVFCYANAEIRKADQADEILRFVEFWQQRTGQLPEELVFDSKLTTYRNLNWLNQQGIKFITLRRRSRPLLTELKQRPVSAWKRIELKNIARAYRTPKVLESTLTVKGYEGPLRQLAIIDLGHEEPTLLLTNHLKLAPSTLITRYAQRMIIENQIEDGIDFFHVDALSSAVALKVNCDLQLTLIASSLYRLLAMRIAQGYEQAKSRHVFRDFIEASAQIEITENTLRVRFQKRAHNPLLLAAGFAETNCPIPWLDGKHLHLQFG
jgi:hypothetical protein